MEETVEKPLNNGIIKERDEKGRIKKGTVLNPNGKPKGTRHFTTLFKDMLQEKIKMKDGTEMTMLRAMGLAMARSAIKGNVKAFEQVADRLDGKAVQAIEHTITEPPIPILPIKNRSVKITPNELFTNNSNGQDIKPNEKD